MKDLLETITNILWFAFCLAVIFVFQGEPDLWDKWHQVAMEACK